MPNDSSNHPASRSAAHHHHHLMSSEELEMRLIELQAEREELIRQKRRNVLIAGAAVSLLVHLLILLYLDSIVRAGPAGAASQFISYEVPVITEEELTRMEQSELEVDAPKAELDLSEMPELPELETDVTPPVAELEAVSDGSMATLGGGAQGESGLTLGGGGAGTSFFGISSTGSRFAYIVDISGSMQDRLKIRTALRELSGSVSSLPDFAYFYVILYSSSLTRPAWQEDWIRARPSDVNRLNDWLNVVTAGGGTEPVPAFAAAFALPRRPDVIFFLTDGQIPDDTALHVAEMNKRGGRVVINTIAFGDPRSQDLLRKIANESGGRYRFIPAGGG